MKSQFADADQLDLVEENVVDDANDELADVEVTLLSVSERNEENAVHIKDKLFREAFKLNCDSVMWTFQANHVEIQQMFDNWGFDVYLSFVRLYGYEFNLLHDNLQEGVARLHECGGITMVLTRNGVESVVQLRAASLGSDVSVKLIMFLTCLYGVCVMFI